MSCPEIIKSKNLIFKKIEKKVFYKVVHFLIFLIIKIFKYFTTWAKFEYKNECFELCPGKSIPEDNICKDPIEETEEQQTQEP